MNRATYTVWIAEQMARGGSGYAYAIGLIEAAATSPSRTDAERLAAIRDVLAALDAALAVGQEVTR